MKLTIVAATGGVGRHVLEQAVDAGHDVTAEHGIVSRGTTAIVDAMTATGVRRFLAVSVAGAGLKRDPGAGFFVRYVINPLSNRFLGRHYADVALMEDILRGSGLDWTAVGLPVLTDKPPTGTYRTAYGQSVRRGLRISRADAAGFLLHAVDQPMTFGQSVAIAY